MKIRSDFVSNSSSSSFIVKASPDVPDFMRNEKLSFDEMTERFFDLDVFSDAYDFGIGISSGFTEQRTPMICVEDRRFVEMYKKGGGFGNKLVFLKSHEKIAEKIQKLRCACKIMEDGRHPALWSDGKPAGAGHGSELSQACWRMTWRKEDEISKKIAKILKPMRARMIELLRAEIGKWDFYYSELEDCASPGEDDGKQAARKMEWSRIFSNH